jgi:hypothetical protein
MNYSAADADEFFKYQFPAAEYTQPHLDCEMCDARAVGVGKRRALDSSCDQTKDTAKRPCWFKVIHQQPAT